MSPKPKAPLRRTNGAIFNNRENRHEAAKFPYYHLQNNNNIHQHHVSGEQKDKEILKQTYLDPAQKVKVIEIEIEDEDRFLPSNLLADSNSGYVKDQDSIQNQKVLISSLLKILFINYKKYIINTTSSHYQDLFKFLGCYLFE